MAIYIGADHRGFEMKQEIIEYFKFINWDFEDLGAHEMNQDDDYNDYAIAVAEAVLRDDGRGLLLCGSAQGMCMQANRFRGIRAAICGNVNDAKLCREHNDANILCLPADEINSDFASIINVFFTTDFLEESRHKRRVEKLDRF